MRVVELEMVEDVIPSYPDDCIPPLPPDLNCGDSGVQTMLKLYIITAKCNHHINILFVPVVTKYTLKVNAETNVGLVVNCLMN